MVTPILTRKALSLLELLLTLAISGILLSAISSSMLAHYQTTAAGERLIEQARTVQAWNQRLRRDLSLVPRADAGLMEMQEPGGESSVRERVLNFGYSYSIDAISLWGDRQQLAISRMVASRGEQGGQTTPLVQETIIWSDQPAGKWAIPFTSFQQGTALARLEQPTSQNNALDGNSRIYGPVRAVVRLEGAPRVVEQLSFPFEQAQCTWRYSDGQRWFDSWDSRMRGGLPFAVEVRITGQQMPTALRYVYGLRSQEQRP